MLTPRPFLRDKSLLLRQKSYFKDEFKVQTKSWVACVHGQVIDEPHTSIAILERCLRLVPAGEILDSLKSFTLGGSRV